MPVCLACSHPSSQPLVEVLDWTYWDCDGCGAAFLDEQLLSRQEEVHTGKQYKLNRLLVEARNQLHNEWLADLLTAHADTPGGRILEVGCGAGFFLRAIKKRGFSVQGIDLGSENSSFADAYLDIDVRDSDFLTEPFEGDFDWVVMHQLIEHVPSPGRFIARAKALLRPGGKLLITTPNLKFARRMVNVARLRRGPLKVTGDALGHPPSHCVLFEPQSLERLLVDQGMDVVAMGHNPTGFQDGRSRAPRRIIRRAADRFLLSLEGSKVATQEPLGPNFYCIAQSPQ